MQMAEETGNVPKSLEDMPEIEDHLYIYWSSFWDLCAHRQSGMGVSPLLLSDILEYGKHICGLTGQTLRIFYGIIREMDGEAVKYLSAKIEAEQKRKSKGK